MAQRAVESWITELVRQNIERTGKSKVAYAGGVASNVKANMLLREMVEANDLYVFPHMGDGGLALGAAMWKNYERDRVSSYSLPDVFLGPSFSDQDIQSAVNSCDRVEVKSSGDPGRVGAELLARGEIIVWFQGRMEFGPRALGGRSILALPDSEEIKNRLNLSLKKRVWYQPFCPSLLESEAARILENPEGIPDRFMTCAYRTLTEHRQSVRGVINVDGSCRPQIVPDDDSSPLAKLLIELKKKTGWGVVLNTSFNIHGEPIVCTPEDALNTFLETDLRFMIMGSLPRDQEIGMKEDPSPSNGLPTRPSLTHLERRCPGPFDNPLSRLYKLFRYL